MLRTQESMVDTLSIEAGVGLWGNALEKLPDETKKVLLCLRKQEPTRGCPKLNDVDEITALLSQQKRKYDDKKSIFRIGTKEVDTSDKLSKIMDWVRRFKEIGDIAVSFDPVHAALPWAALRFILQASLAEQDKMETITTLLETVSRLIQHGKVIEKSYLENGQEKQFDQGAMSRFREALIELYAEILRGLGHCCHELKKGTLRNVLTAPFKLGETEGVLSKLLDRWNVVEEQARSCDRARWSQISHELSRQYSTITMKLDKLLVSIGKRERRQILEEISEIPFGGHHEFVSERRTAGTGDWLLQSTQFEEWQASQTSFFTVLYGSPGAGKTYLISRVIDHIKESLAHPSTEEGLAYFYCNRNEEVRRKPESVLRSIARQLASPFGRVEQIHQVIQDFPESLREKGLTLNTKRCQEMLMELISSYRCTTIIIDALDECDRDSRRELLDSLSDLVKEESQVRIFVSSRRDSDIVRHFKTWPIVEIDADASQKDIEKFIAQKLKEEKSLEGKVDLQNQIKKGLFERSNGMFQWAALQVQRICKLEVLNEKSIESHLKSLPKDLKGEYDRIWAEIHDKEKDPQGLADRALRWVFCAREPLPTEALVEAMMVDPLTDITVIDDPFPEIGPTAIYSTGSSSSDGLLKHKVQMEKIIDGLCRNLLTFDKGRGVWQFCHLSAVEYVEKWHEGLLSHCSAAIFCLNYLVSERPFRKLQRKDFHTRTKLEQYISDNWAFHAKAQERGHARSDLEIRNLLTRFLGSIDQSSAEYKAWADGFTRFELKSELSPIVLPIFGVVALGLNRVIEDWWQDSPGMDLNVCNSNGLSLLGLAVKSNQEDSLRFLLERGADIEGGVDSTPLIEASQHEHNSVVLELIKNGAMINRRVGRLEATALCEAIFNDDAVVVTTLLDNGADVNFKSLGLTPFEHAVWSDRKDLVPILLRHGATFDRQVILAEAAGHGWIDYVRDCLEEGTDVNASITLTYRELEADADANSPTALAYWKPEAGSTPQEVRISTYGSVLGLKRVNDGTALMAAARGGHLEVAKMLIHAGADVNIILKRESFGSDNPGLQTALGEAASRGHDDIIQLLLQAGANPNNEDIESPLCEVLLSTRDKDQMLATTRLLLENGANVNHVGGSAADPPLVVAIRGWRMHIEVVKFLLEQGADPNMAGPSGSPLAVASALSFDAEELLGLFLASGADPDYDHRGAGHLCKAACHERPESLRKLLGIGANPTLTFDRGAGSALATAAYYGNVDCCHFLLQEELGVDVNAPLPGLYKNALWAAINGRADEHERVIEQRSDPWGFQGKDGPGTILALLEAGAHVIMPVYSTLKPLLGDIRLAGHEEYAITASKGICRQGNSEYPISFPTEWLRVMWEMAPCALPRQPRSRRIRHGAFPNPLPPLIWIAMKLTSASPLQPTRYVFIGISGRRLGRFVFVSETKSYETVPEYQLITTTLASDSMPTCQEYSPSANQMSSYPPLSKSCEPLAVASSWQLPYGVLLVSALFLYVFLFL